MTTQRVTIELPEPVLRQLVRIAEAADQPVEALVAQSVISNLSPSAENAPLELQSELLSMQNLSTQELLAITQAEVETSQHVRHAELLQRNGEGLLTHKEQQHFGR